MWPNSRIMKNRIFIRTRGTRFREVFVKFRNRFFRAFFENRSDAIFFQVVFFALRSICHITNVCFTFHEAWFKVCCFKSQILKEIFSPLIWADLPKNTLLFEITNHDKLTSKMNWTKRHRTIFHFVFFVKIGVVFTKQHVVFFCELADGGLEVV